MLKKWDSEKCEIHANKIFGDRWFVMDDLPPYQVDATK